MTSGLTPLSNIAIDHRSRSSCNFLPCFTHLMLYLTLLNRVVLEWYSVYSEEDIRRLTWQSRRGMWELDLLFVPFMENHFRNQSIDDQDRFVKLLDCEDQELFLWFMQREKPADPEMERAVTVVLDCVRACKV